MEVKGSAVTTFADRLRGDILEVLAEHGIEGSKASDIATAMKDIWITPQHLKIDEQRADRSLESTKRSVAAWFDAKAAEAS